MDERPLLSLCLFNIFVKCLDDWAECILSKFAHDRKLGGVADTAEDHPATQKDLSRLEIRADKDLMQFNMGKCKVLHLGRESLRCQHVLEASGWKTAYRKGCRTPS